MSILKGSRISHKAETTGVLKSPQNLPRSWGHMEYNHTLSRVIWTPGVTWLSMETQISSTVSEYQVSPSLHTFPHL